MVWGQAIRLDPVQDQAYIILEVVCIRHVVDTSVQEDIISIWDDLG